MGTKKLVEKDDNEGGVVQVTPKEGPIDLNKKIKVKVQGSPYHKEGEEIECSPVLAEKMEANGWGNIVTMLALFMAFTFAGMISPTKAQAQNTAYQVMKVRFANADVLSDTITNTATGLVKTLTPMANPAMSTNVIALFTKISGTLAGTATLMGSNDGTNYATVKTANYAGTFTYTVTDTASQTVSFVILNNPYKYYQVSWTGTGTMSGTVKATIWSH